MPRPELHSHLHKLPPCPTRFPHLDFDLGLRLRDNTLGELMRIYRELGPAFTLRLPGIAQVFLVGPEANQYVTVSHHQDFTWGDGFLGLLVPFIGRGLLTTDDVPHDRARRLLQPAFAPARIRAAASPMVRHAAAACDALREGELLEVHEWARTLALSIAGDVLFGFAPDAERSRAFAHHFEEGLSFYGGSYLQTLLVRGPFTPYARMRRHAVALHEAIAREIDERRARGARPSGENVLDTLLAAGEGGERLDDREIRDQVVTLLFAGHDTTAATVSWMFMLLGQHPQVLRRLVAEIEGALPDRDPTADDLISGLPYLDMVVKETLRLYPAAWFGPRRARKDFNMYGHKIPAGTLIAYSSWLTHRIPDLWPDPDAFEPERFVPERSKHIQPGAYVPFGRGPRICIGMRFGELEIKAIAATLLRRWHLELFPGQDFRARTIPTISPRDGVLAYVRRRGTIDARQVPGAERKIAAPSSPSLGAARCPVDHTPRDS